jgi:LysR family glycine cleavage system transcriptional activator
VTWPHWLDAAGLGDVVDGGLGDQFDTAALALQLAELGCGVALGRQSLVQDRVTAGRLAAPLAPALDTDEAFHLVHAADTAPSPPAARVAAWLRAAAEDGNLRV